VDREQNRAWAAAIAPTLDPISTEEQITAAEAAMREWDAYTRELMAERRRKPAHALLDDMLAVEEDGTRLTSDEIAANTTFLFLAGHETTTDLIGNGLFALMRHPDQLAIMARALFRDHLLSDLTHLREREGEMVRYAKRRVPRPRPSEDQRKFLELLRDLGPRDNAQTAAVRKATKRACQVRGWVEWRSLDNFPGKRAWHLTIIGQKAVNRPVRSVDNRNPARLRSISEFWRPA